MKSPSIFRVLFLTGLAATVPGVAHAQRIGADIGYSYLLDSKTRSAFGSSVTEFGFGFGKITPSLQPRVGLDLSILRPKDTRNGVQSDALVITAGPEYRKVYIPGNVQKIIAQRQQQQQLPPEVLPPGTQIPNGIGGPPPILPYYGASVNLIYAQVNAPFEGRDGNGFGVGGSVFAGVAFSKRVYLEGRLRATTKIEGYGFSRAGITAGIRF